MSKKIGMSGKSKNEQAMQLHGFVGTGKKGQMLYSIRADDETSAQTEFQNRYGKSGAEILEYLGTGSQRSLSKSFDDYKLRKSVELAEALKGFRSGFDDVCKQIESGDYDQ